MFFLSSECRKALKVLEKKNTIPETELPFDMYRANDLISEGYATWTTIVPKGKEDFENGLRGLKIQPKGKDALKEYRADLLDRIFTKFISIAALLISFASLAWSAISYFLSH